MPAQNKTKNLKLNQWQENEYPKMVDFNDDNQKIDVAFGNIEQKVTEGVENLDISEKQVKFEETSTRTLPKTGDTLKTIAAKITKYLKDLKTVAFTGEYGDLTGIPESFPPAAHNHDDRYLGKREKAESAKIADKAKTAEQVQGFQFRNQNGKLEVLVEGRWIPVGGKNFNVTKILTGPIAEYAGGAGVLKYIQVISERSSVNYVTIDNVKIDINFIADSGTNQIYSEISKFPAMPGIDQNFKKASAVAIIDLEFKNSFKVEGYGAFSVIAQTEK